MEKKNIIRLIIQIAIGLIIAVGVMTSQGAFAEGVSAADRILAIGNGFSVIALLYIALVFLSGYLLLVCLIFSPLHCKKVLIF